MALVRMIVKLSGTRDGVEWPAVGAVLECPAEEAAQLIGTHLAVDATPARSAAPVESATASPAPETAAAKRAPGRPRKDIA